MPDNAKIGFMAFGTSDYAVRESCDQLQPNTESKPAICG